ncbi:MAG: SDR family oxidoreductase [Gemmatimonadaceae bacterium]|jgi:NAD(P)-dependent dehydrogenase (short-subunit alcohol dehydrogenase family)|nr:SDR family oxidoreductase [Gemmatimonadaceae bacterium]
MSAPVRERFGFAGRTVLVTGAAGHLGRALADAFAELGASLVLVDRDAVALATVATALRDQHGTAVTVHACDLEDEGARQALLGTLVAAATPLHVLVNNAAFVGTSDLAGWAVPFEQQATDTWRRAIEVNLTAPFELARGLLPCLRATPGANIVNIGSIYGALGPDWSLYAGTPMANPAAYAASKGGLLQLTRWLATTCAPAIRVNAVSPGGIARGQPDAFVERYAARTPLARMASETDIVGAVTFLASDLAAYITGQVLAVDGGWSAW